jgi:hypothetical protein
VTEVAGKADMTGAASGAGPRRERRDEVGDRQALTEVGLRQLLVQGGTDLKQQVAARMRALRRVTSMDCLSPAGSVLFPTARRQPE